MNNYGINKQKMYVTVRSVLASNQAVWSTIPACEPIYDLFCAKMEQLQQLAFDQEAAMLGVKKVKDKERRLTAKRARKIANALRIYAGATGNTALLEQVSFRDSDLDYSSSTSTLQLMGQVSEAAVAHAATLAGYGISQQQIDEFEQMREHLVAAFASTRSAIVDRGKNTELITELIREINGILRNSLDKFVEILKEDHPEFAIAYRKAREIVDLPGKKNKKGTLPPLLDVPNTDRSGKEEADA